MEKSSIGVVGKDLCGYPYNIKYQPNTKEFGGTYLGYKTWNQEVFFHEFAVQGFDVTFKFNGVKYFLMSDADCCCTCKDDHFVPDDDSQRFANGNELIENLLIDGKTLLSIIDVLEEVEIW